MPLPSTAPSTTPSATPSTGPIVEVHDLTRRFGDLTAVDHANLAINAGEIFGVIGPNGAGKSTFIKMLTTLLPPTSGTATIAGYDIRRQAAEVRRHIGYVPQLLSADGMLTGYENLQLSARLYGVPRAERAQRIDSALRRMGLSDAAHHLVGHYSGGMIRRLEIAQSLLHRPQVLFLDEPTVGLDPSARAHVWDRVFDLQRNFNTTMIVTSHHMDEVDQVCTRIALIEHGRISTVGTTAELKAKVGPDATLDDVYIQLVGREAESETEEGYGSAEQARRAAREHG